MADKLYVVMHKKDYHPDHGMVDYYGYFNDDPKEVKAKEREGYKILARGLTATYAKKIIAALEEGDATANPKGRMKKRRKVNTAVARAMGIGKKPRNNPFVTLLSNPPMVGHELSEKGAWEYVLTHGFELEEIGRKSKDAHLKGSSPAGLILLGKNLQRIATLMLEQLRRGVHKNPRGGKYMGDVTKVLYVHVADGEPYKHVFPRREGLPQLLAMPDGSLRIEHGSRR